MVEIEPMVSTFCAGPCLIPNLIGPVCSASLQRSSMTSTIHLIHTNLNPFRSNYMIASHNELKKLHLVLLSGNLKMYMMATFFWSKVSSSCSVVLGFLVLILSRFRIIFLQKVVILPSEFLLSCIVKKSSFELWQEYKSYPVNDLQI